MHSTNSIRVDNGVNTFRESVDNGVNTLEHKKERRKHSRIPWEVGTDERLTDRDVRVYFALASFTRRGPRASAGIRWIADCIHVPARYVIDSLRRLSECGHIALVECDRGKRREYRLLSPVFEIMGHNEQIQADTPTNALISCPRCQKSRKKLTKAGWCYPCARETEIERQVAAILQKSPEATREQVYVSMKAESAKAVQKAIRKIRGAA